METFEKKYNDALERAKQGLPMDEVFPELKESEDERIRKALIKGLNFLTTSERIFTFGNIPIEDIVAYLERQKEQILIPKFKVGDCIYDKRDSYNRNVIREVGKDYYINAFAQKMDMAYTDANFEFLEHLDNDLIDSKPAEKQDYFGLTDLERAIHRGFLSAGVENVPVTIIKETAQECLAQINPAVWSEEDERNYEYLHQIICNYINNPQIEYKERDKASIVLIPFWEKLKSLRPSWKPSEEQMKCLGDYVGKSKRIHDASMGGYDPYRILNSLYVDLKKLM